MKLRNVLIVLVGVLLAPAAWLLVSGLYVGLVAPGAEPSDRLQARLVLWRDVLRARSRMTELEALASPPPRSGPMPVYVYYPSPPASLSETLPTCEDHVVEAQAPKTDGVFRAGSMPVRFPLRGFLEDDVTYFAYAHQFSVPELALLHACFRATPFDERCNDWMERERPSRDDVMARLVESGWVGRRSGSYCWQLPEFRFPE